MNVTLPIHHHALRLPGKPAVVTPEQTLTYGELDGLIWRAASHIAAQGLKTGDIVGLAVQQPLLHLVTALALSRMGIAYHAIAADEGAGIVNGMQKEFGARAVVTATALPGLETRLDDEHGPASRGSRSLHRRVGGQLRHQRAAFDIDRNRRRSDMPVARLSKITTSPMRPSRRRK